LSGPTAIAFGSYSYAGVQRHELFVIDKGNLRIQVFKVNFRFSGAGGSGDTDIEYSNTIPLAWRIRDVSFTTIDNYPYLILSDDSTHSLRFYDLSTGSYSFKNSYGSYGSGTGQFNTPICADGIRGGWSAGKSIFVIDHGNWRIVRLVPTRNADGTIAIQWSTEVNWNYPLTSLSTDEFGNVWVTDVTNNQIVKFNNNLQYLATFGSFGVGQVSEKINTPKRFTTGNYVIKNLTTYTQFKNDVSFLVESWGDNSGGLVLDLGTSMTALSVSGPSNLVGTTIAYFVTDWSWIYVTIEKQSGSSWNLIKTFGYPINGVSGQVVGAGANSFTWDGRDVNGILQGAGTYRITAYAREFYEDPDAPTVSRQVTYAPPLSGSISGPSNVNYGQNYTWNASGSGGTTSPYTYEWYKGNTYVGNNSYLTTSFTSNTTLYLKVRSGADQITVSKAITVGSGGGCPFVSAETPYGFEPDNNILHRSELSSNKGRDIEDLYALRVKPQRNGQSYRLQVREYNEDYSYFDQFNLYYIDHAAEKQIGVTEENEIVLYDRSLIETPVAVELADGRPLEQAGSKNDVMNLRFSKASIDRMNSSGSKLALLIDLERPAGLLPPGKEGGGAITVRGSGDGLRKDASSSELNFYWRTGNSTVLIPLAQGLNLEEFNITWTRDYAINSIGLVNIEPAKETKKLQLTSARHSRRGDVTDRIVSTDKKYAEMGKDDYIDLTFRDDSEPNESLTRNFVFTTTGRYVVPSNGEAAIPTEFGLDQNYPNPFNPSTQIRYYLPQDTRVMLKVYNLLGQEVRTLVSGFESAGIKTINWDGRNDQGHRVASGVYIYKLTVSNFTKARKLMLVK
jgi:hypothetical protein